MDGRALEGMSSCLGVFEMSVSLVAHPIASAECVAFKRSRVMSIKNLRKGIRSAVLAACLAGGTLFDLGGCFQTWVEEGIAHQECLDEYGHKPDFVEELCF